VLMPTMPYPSASARRARRALTSRRISTSEAESGVVGEADRFFLVLEAEDAAGRRFFPGTFMLVLTWRARGFEERAAERAGACLRPAISRLSRARRCVFSLSPPRPWFDQRPCTTPGSMPFPDFHPTLTFSVSLAAKRVVDLS